jgi:hypothetical protein
MRVEHPAYVQSANASLATCVMVFGELARGNRHLAA